MLTIIGIKASSRSRGISSKTDRVTSALTELRRRVICRNPESFLSTSSSALEHTREERQ